VLTAQQDGHVDWGARQALVKKLISFEDEAVDKLVPLLADKERKVASLAGEVLRDVERIDKKYLPQILAGMDRKLNWLPGALGLIDSPEAAHEAVKRYLVSESAPHNQEALAVRLSGRRAIPFILEAASCKKACGESDHYLLGYALSEMDEPERVEAAKALMKIVRETEKPDVAKSVLLMIGQLGRSGLVVEQELLKLREQRPDLNGVISRTFIGIESKHAAKVFIDLLADEPNIVMLRDLSGIGIAGHDAGPSVEKLLQHADFQIRIGAVTTLGFIRYEKSVPKLIAMLSDPTDVRLNKAAAMALGRIRDKSAKTALTTTAENHWHPAVRKMAADALVQLYADPDSEKRLNGNFAVHFFSFEDMDTETCEITTLAFVNETTPEKWIYSDKSKKKLESLSYKSEIIGYGVSDEEEKKQKAAGKDIIVVTPGNMVRNVEVIEQVPTIALRAEGGWLAGSSRGEWGGELVFIKDGGVAQKILDTNLEDIYLHGDRYIAVTGLAHLGMNNGMLYELIPDKSDHWSARPWRALPGAPRTSGRVESGEILVNTNRGGSVLIAKDGSMRMATCVKK
ncbi:MAG: hypothetical protein ACREO2_04900, partial [Arenimonas sp.]